MERGLCETHEIIIPVEEVAYAACNRPTMKDQPSGHPELFSKWVNTHSALWRPSAAMARTQTMMAMTAAKVQKIAAVYVSYSLLVLLVSLSGVCVGRRRIVLDLHRAKEAICCQEQTRHCTEE